MNIFHALKLFALVVVLGAAPFTSAQDSSLPDVDLSRTALLITDPQNDFLHPKGGAYALVKENIERLNTIKNIESLFAAAKKSELPVFVSPHEYKEHDHQWQHRGALVKTMHDIKLFFVADDGGETFGSDFLERFKPYILDGKTVISSPHKVYGPDSNDLVLQLRKRGIESVFLSGLAANLCTDSHMRELIENGFEVHMISDAVGAPGEEAYQAALLNYGMIANGVLSTEQVLALLNK